MIFSLLMFWSVSFNSFAEDRGTHQFLWSCDSKTTTREHCLQYGVEVLKQAGCTVDSDAEKQACFEPGTGTTYTQKVDQAKPGVVEYDVKTTSKVICKISSVNCQKQLSGSCAVNYKLKVFDVTGKDFLVATFTHLNSKTKKSFAKICYTDSVPKSESTPNSGAEQTPDSAQKKTKKHHHRSKKNQ